MLLKLEDHRLVCRDHCDSCVVASNRKSILLFYLTLRISLFPLYLAFSQQYCSICYSIYSAHLAPPNSAPNIKPSTGETATSLINSSSSGRLPKFEDRKIGNLVRPFRHDPALNRLGCFLAKALRTNPIRITPCSDYHCSHLFVRCAIQHNVKYKCERCYQSVIDSMTGSPRLAPSACLFRS